jgi:ribosomal 30S subunit maturation factor RimM
MVSEFIREIDKENKRVTVETPQGLIEMNLE